MGGNQEKRFFWLKLKVNFMTSETVDFLMSQKDGANYIVLYQMLCLKTINTDGRLCRTIGEIIIPFDENKIQRDCKWFSIDTIRVAMELYKRLGLIYEDTDGTLVIADHKNLIGSECESAERMRRMRNSEKLKALPESTKASQCDAECDAQCNADCDKNVTTEIEYRDRDKEIEFRGNNVSFSDENDCRTDLRQIAEKWNELGVSPVKKLTSSSARGKMISARIREYGLDTVLQAIENIKRSPFLRGENKNGWMVTIDWFAKPNNFIKVSEGQYNGGRTGQNRGTSSADRIRAMIERGEFRE